MVNIYCGYIIPIAIAVFLRWLLHGRNSNNRAMTLYGVIAACLMHGVMKLLLLFYGVPVVHISLRVSIIFTIEYIVLSSVIGMIPAFIEKRGKLDYDKWLNKCPADISLILLILLSFLLVCLNCPRIMDNNFWGDEAFSTNLIKNSWKGVLIETARDVHPPLYYLILKSHAEIFGYQGWVYHLVSFEAYVLQLVFILFPFRKQFGNMSSLLMILFSSLLKNSLFYMVEVRMYSWMALFVFIAFFEAYKIYDKWEQKDFILLSVFSLAAAYTHYFGLITVSILYLCIIGYAFLSKKDKRPLMKSALLSIVLYIPWLIFFLRIHPWAAIRDASKVEDPEFLDFFLYLFDGKMSRLLLLLSIICLCIALATFPKWEKHWIITGIICIAGTIGIGITESLRHDYNLRYGYPLTGIACMILSVCLTRKRVGKLLAGLVAIIFFYEGMIEYKETVVWEKITNEGLEQALSDLSKVRKDDTIYTDYNYLTWQVLPYYFPDTNIVLCSVDQINSISSDHNNYLIVKVPLTDQQIDEFNRKGMKLTIVSNDTYIGLIEIYAYELS